MEEIIGSSLPVFIGLTLVLFGGAAFLMGQALADTWRPAWQNFAYGLLLGVANRLVSNFLFAHDMLSVSGYLIQTAVLMAIAFVAYRATRARKMVLQYPWLYERHGLFGWRQKTS